MHSTAEGEPILESSRPRERPAAIRSPTTTPAVRRVSGEGAPLRTPTAIPVRAREHAAARAGQVQRLLRHRLTSPEKRTVKRIQAQRLEYFAPASPAERPSLDLVRARVLQMLREDRGLQQGLDAEAYERLAAWLVDEALSGRAAAEIVGLFLREVGAMERPELSAPRVKNALRVLNEVLYGDAQHGPIPQGVREFRLEKRDGGLQIVGLLRTGADEAKIAQACAQALRAVHIADVDVRLISRR